MGDKFTITAPVDTFSGALAGLMFQAGKATADSDTDARALAYCRRHNYRVEPLKAGDVEPAAADEPARPKPADPKADWVAYAISRGADSDAAADMTKADLVDRYGRDL